MYIVTQTPTLTPITKRMKEERKMEIQIKALKLYKKSIVVQKQEAVIISKIFYLNF